MLDPHRRGILTAIPSQSRANLGSAWAVERLTDRFVEVRFFLSLTAMSPILSDLLTFEMILIKINLLNRFRSFHRE